MKILQLSYRLPYPLKDGGAIGIYNITRAFYELGHEVTLLSFNTKKHFVEPAKIGEELKRICKLNLVEINTNLNPFAAFWNLLQNKSYHISRFESKVFEKKLIELLQNESFDFIELEGAFMGIYIPIIRKYSDKKIVLRSHNVEFEIWQKLALNASFPKNIYLKILANQLKKFEIKIWKEVDVVAAINEEEKQFINQITNSTKAQLFPAGIFLNDFENSASEVIEASMFHLGSMEWLPNVEAVDWFLEKVFPNILAANKSIKFYLAGRKMQAKYFEMADENLIVEGEVDDAKNFMSNKQLMIVPLLSGGGVRIKILEAMALEKAIVATSQAASGLNYTDGKNIVIADSAVAMQQAIIELLKNPTAVKQLETQARKHIATNFNQLKLTADFLELIAEK